MTLDRSYRLVSFGVLLGILLLVVLAYGAVGCAGTASKQVDSAEGEGHLDVVATTTIVGDVVHQVVGERLSVVVLLPVGADPHTFEPRPQDLAAIADAELIFANGVGLEEFMAPLIASAGSSTNLVEVSADIDLLPFGKEDEVPGNSHEAGSDHASGDPHTWMDPKNVVIWTNRIADSLAQADPAGATLYQANAEAYIRALNELDAWTRLQVGLIPVERRLLVSDHRTLGYFAHAYGFELLAEIVGSFSTSAQPSAQELAALEDRISQYDVPAIFISQTISPALAERVAADTGVQVVSLYTGSLSEPGGPADSYLALLRYNVNAIVAALQE